MNTWKLHQLSAKDIFLNGSNLSRSPPHQTQMLPSNGDRSPIAAKPNPLSTAPPPAYPTTTSTVTTSSTSTPTFPNSNQSIANPGSKPGTNTSMHWSQNRQNLMMPPQQQQPQQQQLHRQQQQHQQPPSSQPQQLQQLQQRPHYS